MHNDGRLTTHVLDTTTGRPAAGLALELFRLESGRRELIVATETNADGRVDTPLLSGEAMRRGTYEIVFQAGAYLRRQGGTLPDPLFLDQVPLRFGIADLAAHYHVPLLLSPFSYSTYRGS